jgi:hypothetical protein
MSGQFTPLEPWGVFDHEVESFFVSVFMLQQYGPLLAKVPLARNLVIEAGLLHLRAVVEVLLSRSKKADNIKLARLVGKYIPARLADLASVYGNDRSTDSPCWVLNKMLVHPTTRRSCQYSYDDILNSLLPLVKEIVEDVRSKRPSATSPTALP